MSAAEQIILSDNDSGSELSSLEEPTHVANDKKRKTEHAAIEKKKLKEDVEVIHIPSVAKEVIDIDNAEYFANLNLKKLCEVGSLESVKQRVEKGEIPDQACVFRAAKYANLDVLSYLLGDLKTKFDKHQKLIKEDHTSESEAILENIKNISALMRTKPSVADEDDEMLKLCQAGDVAGVRALVQEGRGISEPTLHFVVSNVKRELFKELIRNHLLFTQNDEAERVNVLLDSSILKDLVGLGWLEETEYLVSHGLQYHHNDIDEDNAPLYQILARHPRRLKFPFSATETWFSHKRGDSFLSHMEECLAIKQKVLRLFREHEDARTQAEAEHVDAIKFCVESFLRLTK